LARNRLVYKENNILSGGNMKKYIMIFLVLTIVGSLFSFLQKRDSTVDIFPNPVKDVTKISVFVESEDVVKVFITDENGEVVKTLCDQKLKSGIHSFIWDRKDESGKILPAGKYDANFIEVYSMTHVIKVVILK
jgi:flagellar hook assembly protein FlgD